MKISYLFILVFFLMILSCKKESDDQQKISFTGITETDENGEYIEHIINVHGEDVITYVIDSTDWRLDDTFSEAEMALFDDIQLNHTSNSIVSIENINVSFYPNPCFYAGNLHFNGIGFTKSFVLVDTDFNKIITINNMSNELQTLNLSDLDKGIYRIYYLIWNTNNELVGKGHGDIEKK